MRSALLLAALCAVALPASTLAARPVTYNLPAEAVPAELAYPDAELVVTNCSACHSLEYIVTQPRHKGTQFWKDAVTKMVNVYRAPMPPADADDVAALLAKKFG